MITKTLAMLMTAVMMIIMVMILCVTADGGNN